MPELEESVVKVLVLYYSMHGHVHALEGARFLGRRVAELAAKLRR